MSVFDGLRATIDDLLNGRVAPGDRAEQVRQMKQALMYAKLGVEDLRAGVSQTRMKLDRERAELVTVQRRKELATGINDAETVTIAEKFEAQHTARIGILEAKLSAQDAEMTFAERDLEEMTAQLKAAAKGVGDRPMPRGPTDAELGLPDDAPLTGELNELRRASERAAKERAADDKLAELKKKMGK